MGTLFTRVWNQLEQWLTGNIENCSPATQRQVDYDAYIRENRHATAKPSLDSID